MMKQRDIEEKIKALKPTLSALLHVDNVGYFGSFARTGQTDNSDIDIIVFFNKPLGWVFFDLQALLEKELNSRVDFVSIKALKEQLKETIFNEVKYV